MSIFRKDPSEEHPIQPPGPTDRRPSNPGPSGAPRERPATRIAEGTHVTGEVSGGTELVVEGTLEGKVDLDSRVAVGASGEVKGEISARSVLVAGRVVGDVTGTERVEVGPSGKLEGDITAPRVTIAEGAFFKGKVEMSGSRSRGTHGRGTKAPASAGGGKTETEKTSGGAGEGAGEAGGGKKGAEDDASPAGGAS